MKRVLTSFRKLAYNFHLYRMDKANKDNYLLRPKTGLWQWLTRSSSNAVSKF